MKRLLRSRLFRNSAALISGKFLQKLIAMLVSILSARCLGPGSYGLISYAASFVAFAEPIARMGHANIMAYECISRPDEEGGILGTSILMQMASGLLCMLGILLAACLLNPGDSHALRIIALYSMELLFKSFEILGCWFHAHYISKYAALAATLACAVVSVYKAILLLSGAPLHCFALTQALDFLVLGMIYFICYRKKGGAPLRFSKAHCARLWRGGRGFILSSLMIVVYQQTDKVMLKAMVSESAVAYYSVAASLVAMCGFALTCIIPAATPVIIEHSKADKRAFEDSLTGLLSLIGYACFFTAILLSLLAGPIVRLIYDEAYLDAIPALRILAWGSAFSYWGAAKNIWLVVEGKQRYAKWLSLTGAAVNILLNLLLISVWGLAGAAVATVLTEFTVNFLASLALPAVRRSSLLVLRALRPASLRLIRTLFL